MSSTRDKFKPGDCVTVRSTHGGYEITARIVSPSAWHRVVQNDGMQHMVYGYEVSTAAGVFIAREEQLATRPAYDGWTKTQWWGACWRPLDDAAFRALGYQLYGRRGRPACGD